MTQQTIEILTEIQLKIRNLYPTFQKFIIDYKPAQLLVTYDEVNTLEQSIETERMSIEDLSKIYPDEKRNYSVEYIVQWLDYLNRFSNINKQLTELNAVAYMIYKDYKKLYLTDFKIVFEKIMRAEYGTFYGSVDAQRILFAFMQYNTERQLLLKKMNLDTRIEHESLKKIKTDLQRYLELKQSEIEYDVVQLLKADYKDLSGLEYNKKKVELISERLPEALKKGREEYLQMEIDNKK